MDYPLTSIVLVLYNQIHYTVQCVESIKHQTHIPYELVFVDNASTDNTQEYLETLTGATIIFNKKNRGFSKGVNQGILASTGHQILLLNNDTIVTKNYLKNMLRCLYHHEKTGIVGPMTNRGGDRQKIPVELSSREQIREFGEKFNQSNPKWWFQVHWLSGFCMLLKKRVIDTVGLFDERFCFGGAEDIDYSKRARKENYTLMCAGDTFVFHFKNRTFKGEKMNKRKINQMNYRLLREKWGE